MQLFLIIYFSFNILFTAVISIVGYTDNNSAFDFKKWKIYLVFGLLLLFSPFIIILFGTNLSDKLESKFNKSKKERYIEEDISNKIDLEEAIDIEPFIIQIPFNEDSIKIFYQARAYIIDNTPNELYTKIIKSDFNRLKKYCSKKGKDIFLFSEYIDFWDENKGVLFKELQYLFPYFNYEQINEIENELAGFRLNDLNKIISSIFNLSDNSGLVLISSENNILKFLNFKNIPDDKIIISIAKTVYEESKIKIYNHIPYPGDLTGKQPKSEDLYYKETSEIVDEIYERIKVLKETGKTELITEIVKQISKNAIPQNIVISKLVIDENFRIFLADYNNMEIEMTPIVKSVYFLFLRHKKGIMYKDLKLYFNELLEIYKTVSKSEDWKKIKKSIQDITNPEKNSINEKRSRIKEAFIVKFDETYASEYIVDGYRGAPKFIKLKRDLVIFRTNELDEIPITDIKKI